MAISLQHRLKVFQTRLLDLLHLSKRPGVRIRRLLTFRHVIWGGLGVLVIIFYLYAQIVVVPYQKRYNVLMRNIHESRELNTVFADKVSRVLKNQKNETTFSQYLSGDQAGFSETLLTLVEQEQLAVETVNYLGEAVGRAGIMAHTYELTLMGEFPRLGEFLYALFEASYLVEVHHMQLSTTPKSSALTLVLKVSVYLPKTTGDVHGQ